MSLGYNTHLFSTTMNTNTFKWGMAVNVDLIVKKHLNCSSSSLSLFKKRDPFVPHKNSEQIGCPPAEPPDASPSRPV